ncbi:hypothetical protein FVE89_06070 [Methylobacterium sp. 2A]|nr:hypothetical protein [Methylobacterium sp. 2A]
MAPYLALVREDAGQREHASRGIFNGRQYVVRSSCPWQPMPPPCRPGRPCINEPGEGGRPTMSSNRLRIRGRCCAWLRVGRRSPARPRLTLRPRAPHPRAATKPVTMGPSARRARC